MKALEESFNQIVSRHESLRTTFTSIEGRPVQVIAGTQNHELPLVDLSLLEPQRRELEAARLAEEEAQRSFDLTKGPLMRTGLIRLSEVEHRVLVTMHHIVSDGWSMGVLVKELAALYEAYREEKESGLGELEIQYGDYAEWQREWLTGPVLDEQVSYWKKRLEGAESALEIPTDRPRPPVQSFRGGTEEAVIEQELVEELRRLSRREGVTTFMTMLAAFKMLLYRYTGQIDVVVGTPIAGRNRAEIEGLIGFFLNTLVLRTDLAGNPTFLELLKRVQETSLGAYAHQDVPFEKLLEELQLERDLSRTPLFQVFFNMLNLPTRVQMDGVTVEVLSPPEIGAKFDLTLYVQEKSEGTALIAVYNADLFRRERIAELLRQFKHLLSQIVKDPRRRIGDHSLVTPSASRILPDPTCALGAEWEGSVPAIFSEQARRVPQAIALAERRESWTYAELDRRSNRLANHLVASGIQPQDIVAIYGHRSASLVRALLSIMKAGAAFVILDPAYPAPRLIDYLRAAKPRGWIHIAEAGAAPQALEEFIATLSCCCCVELPRLEAGSSDFLAEYSTDDPRVEINADSLAYVSFTSGSSGRPKGILGRHGSLTHFLPWLQERFGLNGTDRFSLLSGLSHDPLHRDVFTPLQLGAAICIPEAEDIENPGRLAQWVKRVGVTVAHLTPAMGKLLTETSQETGSLEIPSLRYAFFVGDVLTKQDVSKLQRLAPSVTTINYYGSTETQRAVGHFVIPPHKNALDGSDGTALRLEKEILPLGVGIKDVQLLILNSANQLAGVGELGEIYLRSPHLALGYLDNYELTRERFLINPFTNKPGDHLYRTGDLGRYMPDGNVEPLGRTDFQVKIRGLRVELGEIEAVLVQHPSVDQCVVIAREVAPGDKRLIGYVVAKQQTAINFGEVRSYLKERLPDYMIPASWLLLDHLPLTPNGKLDRAALPLPAPDRSLIDSSFVAPVSQIQILLADIWADLLKLDRVGLLDNFFDLGGHSLLATQLISRVRDAFSVDLPLRRLLEEPSLHQMAAAVQQALSTGAALSLPRITKADHSGPLPLSYAQQRLWFLHQLDPHSAAYNSPAALRLQGRLNVAALEATFTHLVSRHEVLRTVFATIDGQGCQIIHPPRHQTIPLVDLSGMDDKQRELEAQRLARREALAPFELERGPVIRVLLVKLDEQDHALMVTLHHIVSDGWSMGVLVEEVSSLYSAYCRGEEASLEPLCVQYSDYTLWQREWLVGEALARQMSYWREQLGTQVKAAELPPDRRRPLRQRHRGAICLREIDREVSRGFIEMSRREGVTLYMSLLAVFSSLLYRLSGESEVVIGTPIAGRGSRELEGLIGFFANTLVMKVEVRGEERFKDLLRRVREVALGAYAHQEVPFEKVVEELQPERDLSRQALFQVVLSVQNAPVEELRMEGLEVRRMEVGARAAKFDVVMNVFEREGEMRLECEYDRELYEEGTMRVVMRQMERVMRGVVEGGVEQEVGEIRLESEEEERRWAREWNETEREYPCEKRMEEMIEEQAERTPEREAVRYRGEGISYRELEERANRLANHLIERGVREGERVGVCLSHSIEVVVAILGVMKAGASYVPVDVEHPLSRVEMVLEDAGVRQVIVDQEQADRFEGRQDEGRQVIVLGSDKENEQVSQCSSIRPSVEAGAEGLAYIIYTSGSTGRPKGVKITHRSLANYVWWARGVYQQGEALDFALYSSLAFDLTVTSIFVPLVSGGRVVVYRREGKQELLKQIISGGEVDVVKLTPSHLRLIKEEDNRGSRVRRLIVGGEALESQLAREVYESFGGEVEIDNEYGPTEATVGCMHYRWAGERGEAEQRARVGIGVPAANTKIYVMDERGRCVGENQSGEIWIAGDCLSEGYLNREEETALRFVANPYEEGEVAYRSGDIARRLVGGELEYIGRRDEQVKYHGYRVEMGEIESELSKHEKVRESVVRVKKDGQGREVMVAYYVSREEVEGSELREHLRGRVIEEVIPSLYVRVKKMPLTINGKVDVRGLPGVEEIRERMSRKVKEEEGEREMRAVEEIVGGIWSEVLGLRGVGLRANFFELGGHSLMATQVVTRVREVLGVEIGLRSVFERPTVEGMVERIEQERAKRAGEEESRERKIKRREAAGAGGGAGGEEEEREMSYGQQRIWFMSEVGAGAGAYNVHTSLRMEGELDVAAMERVYNEVVRRHEVLRSVYEVRGGRCVQVVKEWKREVLAEIDVSEMEGECREREVRRVIECEARRGFELEKGPMIRVGMIKEREGERVMMVTMHHIASDGWSMGVMVREVVEMYEAYREGRESELGELEIQYGDYAEWQREWLTGPVLDEQVSYWKKRLEGAESALEIPTDRPRPPVQSFRGGTEEAVIEQELVEELRRLSRREGVTMFMTMLAVFKMLLHRYTGQLDIVVGTDVANRNIAATEKLVGFFTNQLVLRTDLSGDPSFRELLARVREVALGAYDHQDLPFEKIVEVLKPDRDPSRNPLFQFMFAFNNVPSLSLNLPNLKLSLLQVYTGTSVFDFSLYMTATEQGLTGSLRYNSDLFNRSTMKRLLGHFEALLRQVVERPDDRLSVLLESLDDYDRQEAIFRQRELQEASVKKFKTVRRKAISPVHQAHKA